MDPWLPCARGRRFRMPPKHTSLCKSFSLKALHWPGDQRGGIKCFSCGPGRHRDAAEAVRLDRGISGISGCHRLLIVLSGPLWFLPRVAKVSSYALSQEEQSKMVLSHFDCHICSPSPFSRVFCREHGQKSPAVTSFPFQTVFSSARLSPCLSYGTELILGEPNLVF